MVRPLRRRHALGRAHRDAEDFAIKEQERGHRLVLRAGAHLLPEREVREELPHVDRVKRPWMAIPVEAHVPSYPHGVGLDRARTVMLRAKSVGDLVKETLGRCGHTLMFGVLAPEPASNSRRSYPSRSRSACRPRSVPRPDRARRLEQDHLHLLLRDGPMLDPSRHDQELARTQLDRAIAELHPEPATVHEEHLILALVVMPMELALELHRLHLLPVQLGEHDGRPVRRDRGERGRQADRRRQRPTPVTHGSSPLGP